MDILGAVIQQQAAVVIGGAHIHPVPLEQVQYDLVAHLAQVAGDDQVIVGGACLGILKIGLQRLIGRKGHGRAHVGLCSHTRVGDAARRGFCDLDPFAPFVQHHRARGRGRPLGSLGPLAAVFQRVAVLPLCRTKVGRGDGAHRAFKTAIHQASGQHQSFGHGGTGAIQTKKGHVGGAQRKRGADALVQQVAAQHATQLFGGQLPFVQHPFKGHAHHAALRFFPSLFAKGVIVADIVKIPGERPFSLFFPHHRCVGQHPGRVVKAIGISLFFHHAFSSFILWIRT